MNWEDDGLILSVRPHGETSVIVDALTRQHGRHAGLVRGGRRQSGALQPGLCARLAWNARLAEHLGYYRVEPVESALWVRIRNNADAVSALASMLALLTSYLAEREPHPNLYAATLLTLDTFTEPDLWPTAYAQWEIGLLKSLGYGLDIECCAATGVTTNLDYLSPRNGRAVNREAARGHEHRLLELPAFLTQGGCASPAEWLAALRLTTYFLTAKVVQATGRQIPSSREHLIERFEARINSVPRAASGQ